ncbi:MAG: PhnD/SsuA/transferrin family substrate-binding protein [Anaerolineales bacterium]
MADADPRPPVLHISSCMAPLADPYVGNLARWLSDQIDRPIEFVESTGWRAREHLFDHGQIDLIWICGLPYVRKADDPSMDVQLVAAPVMAGSRYQKRPVYFSDVVVRRESPYRTFADLRGASWAFNEPGSHSGFNLTRYQLARVGEDWSYFGRVVGAGSHQTCVAMVQNGEIEAAAIDSTVLELMKNAEPGVLDDLRTIASFGPSPIPPWLARAGLDGEILRQVQAAFIEMDRSERGCQLMAAIGQRCFVPVEDADYDLIREMDQQAASVRPLGGTE